MRRRTFLLGGAASAPLAACSRSEFAAPAGSGIQLKPIRSWSTLESGTLLKMSGVEGRHVRHAVDAWRVLYPSHDAAGRPIVLSGLLALPRDAAPATLVSWHHGTTTTRGAVPSNLSVDGVAAAIVFAGTGRAVVAPDYLG